MSAYEHQPINQKERNRCTATENKKATKMNLKSMIYASSIDPPHYGWALSGNISNLLPPQEQTKRVEGKITKESNPTEKWCYFGESLIESLTLKEKDKNNPIYNMKKNKYGFTMLSYHRGEMGSEPQDPETGKITNEVPKTDTSYGFNPNLKLKVKIQFPLCDDENSNEEENSDEKDCKEYFKEVIEWDLDDPRTPDPLEYATNIAKEFGLSFSETLELASSIRYQINFNVRRQCPHYRPPISSKDPHGFDRPVSHDYTRCLSPSANITASNECLSPGSINEEGTKVTSSMKKSVNNLGKASNFKSKYVFSTEEAFRNEVVRRAKVRQKQLIHEVHGGPVILKTENNHVCHICHGRKDRVALFPCNNNNHAYCEMHLMARFGLCFDKIKEGTIQLDSCPICAYECACAKCSRRLDHVAGYFKKETEKNSISVENLESFDPSSSLLMKYFLPAARGGAPIKCENMATPRTAKKLDFGRTPTPRSNGKRKRQATEKIEDDAATTPKSAKKEIMAPPPPTLATPVTNSLTTITKKELHSKKKKIVPQIPVYEFPKELFNGNDIEPISEYDYSIAYHRIPLATAFPPAINPPSTDDFLESNEDGTIDYCIECSKGGALICCDTCPRSYHEKCLPVDAKEIEDDHWSCHRCIQDRSIHHHDDYVCCDADTLDRVIKSAIHLDFDPKSVLATKILALLHEIIVKLTDYDFGVYFAKPVDVKKNPLYTDFISRPMDFSTIRKNLINGVYILKALKTKDENQMSIFNTAILNCLKDIETIWHNCLLFNEVGSSMSRIAQVQMKKFRQLLLRNIYYHLDEFVQIGLDEYVRELERSRYGNVEKGEKEDSSKEQVANSDPNPATVENFIHVPRNMSGSSRIVGVLDPTSNKIVKKYTSLRAATQAAIFLVNKGFECELTSLSEAAIKNVFRMSGKDPAILLFGFRWLYFDDLLKGEVIFSDDISLQQIHDLNMLKHSESERPTQEAFERNVMAYEQSIIETNLLEDTLSNYFVEQIDENNQKVTSYATMKEAYDIATSDCYTDYISRHVFYSKLMCLFKKVISSPPDSISNLSFQALGSSWRFKLKQAKKSKKEKMKSSGKRGRHKGSKETTNKNILSDKIDLKIGSETTYNERIVEPGLTENTVIIKRSLITGALLEGFETEGNAFNDWLQHYQNKNLPNAEDKVDYNLIFKRDYLEGALNIGGVEWRYVSEAKTGKNILSHVGGRAFPDLGKVLVDDIVDAHGNLVVDETSLKKQEYQSHRCKEENEREVFMKLAPEKFADSLQKKVKSEPSLVKGLSEKKQLSFQDSQNASILERRLKESLNYGDPNSSFIHYHPNFDLAPEMNQLLASQPNRELFLDALHKDSTGISSSENLLLNSLNPPSLKGKISQRRDSSLLHLNRMEPILRSDYSYGSNSTTDPDYEQALVPKKSSRKNSSSKRELSTVIVPTHLPPIEINRDIHTRQKIEEAYEEVRKCALVFGKKNREKSRMKRNKRSVVVINFRSLTVKGRHDTIMNAASAFPHGEGKLRKVIDEKVLHDGLFWVNEDESNEFLTLMRQTFTERLNSLEIDRSHD